MNNEVLLLMMSNPNFMSQSQYFSLSCELSKLLLGYDCAPYNFTELYAYEPADSDNYEDESHDDYFDDDYYDDDHDDDDDDDDERQQDQQ